MASIRSKHNNLINYFICNHKDLSKAYVRKCEKFLTRNKRAGSIPPALKQQAIDESVPYTDIIEANKQK